MTDSISTKLAVMFGLRFMLGRYGDDPCDEVDIDAVLQLPEGLTYVRGCIRYECMSCGELVELPVDVEEYDHGHRHNVCGGSPRCCP